MIGTKAPLKSLMKSCFFEIDLATNTINAILAKSDVWNVNPITGTVIHLFASFTSDPRNNVYINNGIAIKSNKGAALLYRV
jgi:hypothetical protein